MYTIALLYGSVREHRRGIVVAEFYRRQLEARGLKVNFIDPLAHPLPLLNKMYKEMEAPEERFETLHRLLDAADGFLLVSGEYNRSVPPALKNLLDHYQQEFFFKPSALVTYSPGPLGGAQVIGHWRSICAELGMPSIPHAASIGQMHKVFDENGEPTEAYLEKGAQRILDEFEWYLAAFKTQRANGTPY